MGDPVVMETWTKSDPNLRFHKIGINYGDVEVNGKTNNKKSRQILKEVTKHVGQLVRDNRQFFEHTISYGQDRYEFNTSVNPWGKGGPGAHSEFYNASCFIKSWTTGSAGEKSNHAPDERFDIGPDEWFNLRPYYMDEVWGHFEGFVLFDYSDPENIKVRTSWLEQAILKKRQEQQGKVPSLFTLAKQASDKYRLGLPTNTVRTTDTYKRKRDINDVEVTVHGYVF